MMNTHSTIEHERITLRLQSLLGTKEAAVAVRCELSAIAVSLPYSTAAVTQAGVLLLTAGGARQDVMRALRPVGEVMATLGEPEAGLLAACRRAAQVQSMRRLSGDAFVAMACRVAAGGLG